MSDRTVARRQQREHKRQANRKLKQATAAAAQGAVSQPASSPTLPPSPQTMAQDSDHESEMMLDDSIMETEEDSSLMSSPQGTASAANTPALPSRHAPAQPAASATTPVLPVVQAIKDLVSTTPRLASFGAAPSAASPSPSSAVGTTTGLAAPAQAKFPAYIPPHLGASMHSPALPQSGFSTANMAQQSFKSFKPSLTPRSVVARGPSAAVRPKNQSSPSIPASPRSTESTKELLDSLNSQLTRAMAALPPAAPGVATKMGESWAELKEAQALIADLQQRANEDHERIAERDAEIKTLKVTNSSLESTLRVAQREVNESKEHAAEADRLYDEMAYDKKTLDHQFSTLKTATAALEAEIKSMSDTRTTAENEIDQYKRDVEALETDNVGLQEEVEALTETLRDMQAHHDDEQETVSLLRYQVDELEKQVEAATQQCTTLVAQTGEKDAMLFDLRSQLGELQERYQSVVDFQNTQTANDSAVPSTGAFDFGADLATQLADADIDMNDPLVMDVLQIIESPRFLANLGTTGITDGPQQTVSAVEQSDDVMMGDPVADVNMDEHFDFDKFDEFVSSGSQGATGADDQSQASTLLNVEASSPSIVVPEMVSTGVQADLAPPQPEPRIEYVTKYIDRPAPEPEVRIQYVDRPVPESSSAATQTDAVPPEVRIEYMERPAAATTAATTQTDAVPPEVRIEYIERPAPATTAAATQTDAYNTMGRGMQVGDDLPPLPELEVPGMHLQTNASATEATVPQQTSPLTPFTQVMSESQSVKPVASSSLSTLSALPRKPATWSAIAGMPALENFGMYGSDEEDPQEYVAPTSKGIKKPARKSRTSAQNKAPVDAVMDKSTKATTHDSSAQTATANSSAQTQTTGATWPRADAAIQAETKAKLPDPFGLNTPRSTEHADFMRGLEKAKAEREAAEEKAAEQDLKAEQTEKAVAAEPAEPATSSEEKPARSPFVLSKPSAATQTKKTYWSANIDLPESITLGDQVMNTVQESQHERDEREHLRKLELELVRSERYYDVVSAATWQTKMWARLRPTLLQRLFIAIFVVLLTPYMMDYISLLTYRDAWMHANELTRSAVQYFRIATYNFDPYTLTRTSTLSTVATLPIHFGANAAAMVLEFWLFVFKFGTVPGSRGIDGLLFDIENTLGITRFLMG